ncbi:MAG TPA: ATP-binding protein [Archangium sp.]|uniref:ATP-binding protein n=1 Tax=Archangium sp. TaxID=1872627 RepID=UPI002E35C1F6|nr:ATP-binding protein [Archangium sp.]HEX5745516.1 ATP-binding protein [Archangium sp.]
MTTTAALVFNDADKLGFVASVDTSRIYINVADHSLLARVGVGNLVAIQGQTAQEFLIGMVEKVTRLTREQVMIYESEEQAALPSDSQEDTIRAVLVGTYKTIEGTSSNIFKRGTDSFPQIDRSCFIITSKNLQQLMGLLAKDLAPDKRLQIGHYVADRTATAVADGDRFFQRHAAILGSTGSGKSWATALILERASNLQYPNIIVMDMHGEYKPLTKKFGGYASGLRIAGPGDLATPDDDVLFLPYWILNREELLSLVLDRNDQNAPNQASRFTTQVRRLKENTLKTEGKNDVLSTFTVDSPIPYRLEELLEALKKDNEEMVPGAKPNTEKQGEWYGKLTRFISRFETKMEDRRYGFMFKPPPVTLAYDWLSALVSRLLGADKSSPGIKIIDFSEVPTDVLPIVVGVFARLIYDVQFWLPPEERTPLTIVCDEAHLYLPARDDADVVAKRALEIYERIAKEGRKYGVSLLVVSQRPSDVSRTILSQCNNFIALRLTNEQDQGVVRRLMPDSMAGLVDILPLLDVGEALVLGDSVLLPTRIKLEKPKLQPSSATKNFWTDWGAAPSAPHKFSGAIEILRKQTRTSTPPSTVASPTPPSSP